jgi:Ser/Thr protein kinase RdoA (MazF antagonist)
VLGVAVNVDDLLALRGQPPKVGASDAEAVALALYGLTARATALDGERDRNFRLDTSDGGRFVLKFIDHEADDIVVAGQSAALTHIAEQNLQLRVPRVVRTRTAAELGVVAVGARENRHDPVTCRVRLVTYLPGRLIQDSSLAPPGRNLLWLAGNQIAQLDRALAGFFHPALAQPIAWGCPARSFIVTGNPAGADRYSSAITEQRARTDPTTAGAVAWLAIPGYSRRLPRAKPYRQRRR